MITLNLKTLERTHSSLGFKEKMVDTDVKTQGSFDQAMEGKPYYRKRCCETKESSAIYNLSKYYCKNVFQFQHENCPYCLTY